MSAPTPPVRIDHEDDIHWEDLSIPRYFALNTLFVVLYDSALHPFDTIKTRQQYYRTASGTRPLSAWETAREVLRARGPKGLFAGWRASMFTNMPGHLVYFGTYEAAKQVLMDNVPGLRHTQICMLAGVISEFTSTGFHTPGDVIAKRLMVFPLDKRPRPTDFDLVRNVLRTDGPRGLWRGLTTSIMTNSPNSATWFGTYEFAKTHLHRLGWLDPTIEQLACGAMAGFASVVVSNPLDVVRTLVQTSPASTKMSIVGTISRQVRTQGVPGLFRGIGPRLMISVPGSAITFATYELLKKLASKDTDNS